MSNKGINRMRHLKKLVLFAAMLGCCGAWAQGAFAQVEKKVPAVEGGATATCFCKVSCVNLTGQTSAVSVCKDYTPLATYTGVFPEREKNQVDCQSLCKVKAGAVIGSQVVASACCSIGCSNGSTVVAYSAVGTKAYRAAENIGVLQHTPPITVTTCKCPTGWKGDGGVDGGVTTNGKCSKLACQPITVTPFPPNDTKIGSGSPLPWGFSWGNAFYAFGSTANGGAPICTSVTTPGICKF